MTNQCNVKHIFEYHVVYIIVLNQKCNNLFVVYNVEPYQIFNKVVAEIWYWNINFYNLQIKFYDIEISNDLQFTNTKTDIQKSKNKKQIKYKFFQKFLIWLLTFI